MGIKELKPERFWFGSVDPRGRLQILGNLWGYDTEAELRSHCETAIKINNRDGLPSLIFRAKMEVLEP